jgi:C1A family cysteine protease
MKKRVFNLRPDRSDRRDFLFKNLFKVQKSLPKSKDLRKKMSDVEDQGDLGSCTANAFAGNLEFLYRAKKDRFEASRLFLYYNERALIDEIYEDSGAYLRDGIKALSKWGICSENSWPYNVNRFDRKPTDACYNEAATRRISKYIRIETLQEMKQCLADGFPFAFGISVYESFESDRVAVTGTVPNPKASEEMLGGHAMLCVGYNEKSKRFIVRNSWGPDWGANGYCTLPYEYMQTADDIWTVRT